MCMIFSLLVSFCKRLQQVRHCLNKEDNGKPTAQLLQMATKWSETVHTTLQNQPVQIHLCAIIHKTF